MVSPAGRVDDVQIQVEKPEQESGLKIYNADTNKDLEYIEDPSSEPPKTGLA